MKTCKTCRNRDSSGECHCTYLTEDIGYGIGASRKMLMYQHILAPYQTWTDDGRFIAGDDFGCIYHICIDFTEKRLEE